MSKNKNKILKLEQDRKKRLESILEDSPLIEGSYSEILVKCGHPGCHCEKKPIHLVARLGLREDGKIKNKVIRVDDREEVKKLTARYKEQKQALKELEQLNTTEKDLLKKIIKQKNRGYT